MSEYFKVTQCSQCELNHRLEPLGKCLCYCHSFVINKVQLTNTQETKS